MKPYLLQHFLDLQAEKNKIKTAIKHKNEKITYNELYLKSNSLGIYLDSFKLEKNTCIGILLDKGINQVISILGILYSDKIFVIINSILHENQIIHILNDCNIKILITSKKFEEKINKIKDSINLINIIQEENISEIIKLNYGKTISCNNIIDDISTIIYTSGSTGLPKGIVITHRNLIDGAKIVSEYLKITENERILGMLPFNFDYGLNQLTSTLYKGCEIILYHYLVPNGLLKILQDEKITGLASIPTIWSSVFNPKLSSINDNIDFSNLRYITNSGGKLPVTIIKKIRDTFKKTKLYLMYGLTEAFRSTYLSPDEIDKRPDSIGKAIPNVEVEVINEKGKICSPGEIGELIHRGACIARGYWNNKEKTDEVYKPNPLLPKENQFLETVVYSGDLVKKDEDGFIYFIGRKDNMIKTGGYRVSPTEIEELLLKYNGIVESVVFGIDDTELGQKTVAVITLSKKILEEEIINFCKTESPNYLVPHFIHILKEFPKTASGKIDRPEIIKRIKEKYGY